MGPPFVGCEQFVEVLTIENYSKEQFVEVLNHEN